MASIRERQSSSGDQTFAVLYRHGDKQRSKTFATRKAAKDFASLIQLLGVDKALATQAIPQTNTLTVDRLFEAWIEHKASSKVTPRTLKDYRRDYLNWIRPHLGHRVAETVDEMDVQAWVDRIKGKLDPKSVGDRHMILGSMYRFGSARVRKLVTHNPCLETDLPSKRKKAPKGFTRAQWLAMHSWGQVHEPDADDLLLLLHDTGWRFSEATPLTPAAVEDYGDREHDGLAIPWVFVSVLGVHRRDENDRIVYADGDAKSAAGLRRVNLPPESAAMIRRRLVGKGTDDLLFTTVTGRRWHSNNFLSREFQRILDGAGIEKVRGMGPHYLRHTHVGDLDRAGVGIAKTQRRIGHENISTTMGVYGGMIDNALSVAELAALHALTADREPTVVQGTVVRGELA